MANHNHPPKGTAHRVRKNTPWTKKSLKAAITIASLNIRGFGSENLYSPNNKWLHINQLIRDNRIGMLIVQEAHLDEERRDKLNEHFAQRLQISITSDPESPTAKGGVAIVLNKEMVDTQMASTHVVKAGRAISMQLHLKHSEMLTILGVYATNDHIESKYLWEDIRDFYDEPVNRRVPRPDIMLGDFNIVEEAIDHLPPHEDRRPTLDRLDELKTNLGLQDGWRQLNPTERAFTFYQSSTGSQSRIDQIYAAERVCTQARDWTMKPSGIPNTDHMMISFAASSDEAPWIGNRRCTIPTFVLKDKIMRKYIEEQTTEALSDLSEMRGWRTEEFNAQRILHDLKTDIRKTAIDRQKRIVPALTKDICCMSSALTEALNNDLKPEDEKRAEAVKLTERLEQLETKQHKQTCEQVKVKNRLEGETLCRSLCRLGKEKKPRDLIYALQTPSSPDDGTKHYKKNSAKMAELAKTYHEGLQEAGLEQDQNRREACTKEVLSHISKATTLTQRCDLESMITREEVADTLKSSDKNSAAGIDGLTYKFWTELQRQRAVYNSKQEDDDLPDILDLLAEAYRDIQEFGLDPSTNFAEGWMCPIFKKKDKTHIANYRPITLLNTDYKLYMKALTVKLAATTPDLIHKSQACFVPGHQITDHTQLTHMILEYAATADPTEDEDGMIIALDQEKAYNKISHEYLWTALR